jgi:hypothetical protein
MVLRTLIDHLRVMRSLSWVNRLQIERCVEPNRVVMKMQQNIVDTLNFFVDRLSFFCPQSGFLWISRRKEALWMGPPRTGFGGRGARD